jgi:photosynthetic reaction center M subunit
MAYFEYQNIFTQVQVQGAPEWGWTDRKHPWRRTDQEGRLLDPSGLVRQRAARADLSGPAGVVSLATGLLWFNIVGLNMLAQVGWSIPEFIRQLFWLALEPPGPEYGLSAFRRSMTAAGTSYRQLLPAGVGDDAWWLRSYLLAAQHKMGKHIAWAFLPAIWLFLVLGLFRPILMGSWSEAVPYGIFPHLDWTTAFSIRYGNLYYNPFHALSIVFLYGSVLLFAMHGGHDPRRDPLRRRPRAGADRRPRHGVRTCRRCSGAGPWASTPRWRAFTAGPGGSRS